MANKRMFNMKIVDSDAFLDMPLSAQCLYFHLNMRADDDGFIGNVKRIMKIIGSNDDDLSILKAKRFVLEFDSGVIVIKHWRMHNTLSKQRYHETSYIEEKQALSLKENGSYTLGDGNPIDDQHVIEMFQNNPKLIESTCEEQTEKHRRNIGETSENAGLGLDIDLDLDLDIKEKEIYKEKEVEAEKQQRSTKKRTYGEYKHIKLTDEEASRLVSEFGKEYVEQMITSVDEYCQLHGKTYKDYNLAIRTFIRNDQKKNKPQAPPGGKRKFGKSGVDRNTLTEYEKELNV